jgi:hypothetical protein
MNAAAIPIILAIVIAIALGTLAAKAMGDA